MQNAVRALIIVAGAYVAAQLLADIASLRIIDVFGYAVDGGTLVYPFTFTLRDLVHKIGGLRAARTVIFLAAAINLLMAGFFWLVSAWPADLSTGAQLEFGVVLAPVWRIVVASIVAEVIAELIDTEMYRSWVRRFGERRQWGRVLASNSVAVPVDSVIFVLIAFSGVLPGAVMMEIFWVNVAFKMAVTIISIPWIYWVRPERLDPDNVLERTSG